MAKKTKETSRKNKEAPKRDISRKTYIILAVLVVLAALFIRSYHLSTLPPGVYPDESVNGIDAITANAAHHWKLFYENNNGREGLFMNLIALEFQFVRDQRCHSQNVVGSFRDAHGSWHDLARRGAFCEPARWVRRRIHHGNNFLGDQFQPDRIPRDHAAVCAGVRGIFLIRGIQKKKIIDYVFAGLFLAWRAYLHSFSHCAADSGCFAHCFHC